MRKFVSWAKRGLIVLSPLSLAMAMAASAAGSSDTVSPSLRAAMQRDLGLTSAQLSQYLKIERLAALQEKQLAKAQGRNFAGSWIEHKANGSFQLVVATTRSARRRRPQASRSATRATAWRSSMHPRPSSTPCRRAEARYPRASTAGTSTCPATASWSASARARSRPASTSSPPAASMPSACGLSTEEEQPSLRLDLKGGHGYLRNPGDGYLYACSIGFPVTKGSDPVYVTAGHCGDAGENVLGFGAGRSGRWARRSARSPRRASRIRARPATTTRWVRVDSGHTTSAIVYGWGKGDVTVRGGTEAAVGAAICRSGRTSGWRCGTIEAKNQTVNYSSGETITNLTRTTACSEGGDSGGSFITGPGQAQGVLSGGSGSCKGKQPNNRTRSFYQPLLPILQAYNLTLRTGT